MLANALNKIDALGDSAIRKLRAFGDALYLFANACAGLFPLRGGGAFYLRHTLIQQLYFTAVQAFWLVMVVGIAMGVMAVLPLLAFGVGSVDLQAKILNVVMFHQLVPFLTALIVIGRSGTAVTAEIGHMQSQAVIDSLLAMGIEPHRFIVLPRLLGLTISLMLLTLWGDIGAVLGAGVFNQLKGAASFPNFLEACARTVTPVSVVITGLMCASYGVAIALVNAYFGFKSRSAVDVQRNLSPAFVQSFVICIAITALYSLIRT
jgi:phospholipid/cholesterol/gamma-HCH transport system permease protein